MSSKVWDYIVLTVVVIGAINWGLIGFFKFDLVSWLFGSMSLLTRIIYAIVGLGGLYLMAASATFPKNKKFVKRSRVNRLLLICTMYFLLKTDTLWQESHLYRDTMM